MCYVDENGNFYEGNIIENNKNIIIKNHVDSGKELKGTIPMWKEIQTAVREFDEYFPQLKYLGFDFTITDKDEIKIFEINSLTSLDALQMDKPIYDTKMGDFFKSLRSKKV